VRERPPSTRLTIASYNVHRCVGTDGRHAPARVAEVLRQLDADVIGLQEVDRLDEIAQAVGFEPVAGRTLLHDGGHHGNALLTRRPVRAVRRIDLSVPRREPRGALDVDLDVDGAVVRVVVTHLGLNPRERRRQVQHLLAALGDDRRGRIVLLGDINEWFPAGAALRRLHARLGRPRAVATFPSRRPVFALDRMWVQVREALTQFGAHATPLARVASDHLPVRGTIEWRALAAQPAG
jgi:endonuclease/exonuclease/phosphatase family metal-dependent hydrolase